MTDTNKKPEFFDDAQQTPFMTQSISLKRLRADLLAQQAESAEEWNALKRQHEDASEEISKLNAALLASEERVKQLTELLTDIEPSILPEGHRVRRQQLLKASK